MNITKPKNVIPAHSEKEGVEGMVELCEEMGYKKGKNVFIARNGDKITPK
jgi:mRNA degradation ribonuclease J1/J2